MSIALVLLPDFLLIVAGALLGRLRAFDAVFWAGAERLVYFVLFPALPFRSLAGGASAIPDPLPLVATGLAFTLSGIALGLCAGYPDGRQGASGRVPDHDRHARRRTHAPGVACQL